MSEVAQSVQMIVRGHHALGRLLSAENHLIVYSLYSA